MRITIILVCKLQEALKPGAFTAYHEEFITWWSSSSSRSNINIYLYIYYLIEFPTANGHMPLAFYAGNSVASYLECPIVLDRDDNIINLFAPTHTHSFEVAVQTQNYASMTTTSNR